MTSSGSVTHWIQLLQAGEDAAAIQKGEVKAESAKEQLELAELCRMYKRHYTAAVTFYAGAFADPKAGKDLEKPWRYQAASCAARAAAGQGKDAVPLDDPACLRLRRQALAWLQADLVLYEKATQSDDFAKDANDMIAALFNLGRWQQDPDLASVREDKQLERLPTEEQQAWRKLWRSGGHAQEGASLL